MEAASTKTAFLLGFVLATLATVVGLDRTSLAAHAVAASAAIACLLVSAMLLGYSFRVSVYSFGPEPQSLLGQLEEPPLAVKGALVVNPANAIGSNGRLLASRFRWLNTAMTLALGGGVIYSVGVGFT